jgi:hypothetical protein
MEKNLAPGNDGSASLPQNGAPNRPLWKQQAQNTLVFRAIICQTHKLACSYRLSGTSPDNSWSKMFKKFSKLF